MAIMPSCFPFETLVVQSYSSSSSLFCRVFSTPTRFLHVICITLKASWVLYYLMTRWIIFSFSFGVIIIFFSAAEYRRRAEQFGRDCAGAELRDSDLQRNRHSAINGPLAARGRQTHQHQPNTCRYVTHLIVYRINQTNLKDWVPSPGVTKSTPGVRGTRQ